ncbi:unnamed protein product [Ceutorhynchus assimilis]|uniref:Uncharacterized protein n=1 Tax=Ceutorhynchus assimilis TaxID=467358 RepID=A0A9N9QCF1_9CUCU|nr:unnamed protein product [Ceutorhynchus assimilis]
MMLNHTIEQQLEEEYKTLLREIDYLVPAKSCILNFQNNDFNSSKSSEDLTKLLKGYSKAVLETYIVNHESHSKMVPLGNRNDLINYVTEIIVSRPKCNHKLCKCISKKVSILLDTRSPLAGPTENVKVTQAKNYMETATQKSSKLFRNKKLNAELQTDDFKQDPNCTCGCCPKLSSQVVVKNAIEQKKLLQDATTSDKQIFPFGKGCPNCTQTFSTDESESNRKCVPDNFESLLSTSKIQFSTCMAKQDCACDPYDVEEAIKLGVISPGSDICKQNKRVIFNKKRKSKKSRKSDITTSENDTPSETSLSENEKKPKKNKKFKFLSNICKSPNMNRQKDKKTSNISESPNMNHRKDKKTTGCFGRRKKKKLCEEHCQGVIGRVRSIQTMSITQHDKGDETYFSDENNRKAVHTSTDSEIGTQMSARNSVQKILENKTTSNVQEIENENARNLVQKILENKTTPNAQEIETENIEQNIQRDIEISQSRKNLFKKASKTEQQKQQSKEAMICDKCGRQRRDCHRACRNTIILPYGSRSGGAMPAGEAESLRMLIKMQGKDTNRQFNNLITELNAQKNEIQRLNNVYQKMVGGFHESNKSINKIKKAETYECGCSPFAANCGCSFDSECADKKAQKKDDGSSDGRVRAEMADEQFGNKDALKRFGPLNAAVSINICSPYSTDIGIKHLKIDTNYLDSDKKQTIENFKPNNAKYKNGGSGDSISNSLSTLFMMHQTVDQTQKISSFEDIPQNIQQILDKTDVIEIGTNNEDPPEQHSTNRTHSSRVLVWLQKPWTHLKRKRSEFEQKKEERQESTNVLNFCQSAMKRAIAGLWNVAKGKK